MRVELLQALKEKLKEKGFKLTEPRLRVLEYLVNTADHPGIQEIFNAIRREHKGIGLATVYRTMDLLVDTGMVKPLQLNGARLRYELNRPQDHHHHLICTACGRIVEFGSCSFHCIVEDIEKITRFRVKGHYLEAYGLCPHCSDQQLD